MKHISIVSLILVLIVASLVAAPKGTNDTAQTASVLGTGRGIDHVGIAVRDLEGAVRAYRDVLGFTVIPGGSFPGGIRNSAVRFGSNYLELITVDPSQSARNKDASDLASFLEKSEGAYFLGLHVSSAKQTADFLRARGFDVTEPEGSSTTPEGSKEVQSNLWQTVGFRKPVVPADAIFFIQYADRPPKRPPQEHTNTASGIRSVWMAVKDIPAATKAYESVGLRAGPKLQMPQMGATGRVIAAGQGVIVLLQAADTNGTLASYLLRCGEGIIGFSIEVRDLKTARALLQATTKQEFTPYPVSDGEAILIAPNFTHGVWIELFQRRQSNRIGRGEPCDGASVACLEPVAPGR